MESFKEQLSPEVENQEQIKPIDISIGSKVKVKRTSGEIEEGWEVASITRNEEVPEESEVVVAKGSGSGSETTQVSSKVVKLGDLLLWQE